MIESPFVPTVNPPDDIPNSPQVRSEESRPSRTRAADNIESGPSHQAFLRNRVMAGGAGVLGYLRPGLPAFRGG